MDFFIYLLYTNTALPQINEVSFFMQSIQNSPSPNSGLPHFIQKGLFTSSALLVQSRHMPLSSPAGSTLPHTAHLSGYITPARNFKVSLPYFTYLDQPSSIHFLHFNYPLAKPRITFLFIYISYHLAYNCSTSYKCYTFLSPGNCRIKKVSV